MFGGHKAAKFADLAFTLFELDLSRVASLMASARSFCGDRVLAEAADSAELAELAGSRAADSAELAGSRAAAASRVAVRDLRAPPLSASSEVVDFDGSPEICSISKSCIIPGRLGDPIGTSVLISGSVIIVHPDCSLEFCWSCMKRKE